MKYKTKILNLWGGAGIGKTNLAHALAAKLGENHYSVEHIPEMIKPLAYSGRMFGKYDEPMIVAKQIEFESSLYGHVEFIIADMPLLIGSFYEAEEYGDSTVHEMILKIMERAKKDGHRYYNFLLSRLTKYNPNGRYETEQKAVERDQKMKEFLFNNNIRFMPLHMPLNERAQYIFDLITK